MNSTFTFKSFVVDMSSSTATDTTAPSVPASSTSPAWSGSQIAFAILGARDFGAAIVGGLGAKFVLGLSNQESVRFAGICALSSSMGDALSTVLGVPTKISAYDPQYAYLDTADLLAGAVVGGGLFWYLGASDQALMYSAGIAGVAAGTGGKLSTAIISYLTPK